MKAIDIARASGRGRKDRPPAQDRGPFYLAAAVGVLAFCFVHPAESKTTIPVAPGGGGITTLDTVVVTADRLPNSFGGIAGADPIGGIGPIRDRRESDIFEPNVTQPEESSSPRPGTRCPVSGNPVVLANGNKVETAIDFESTGDMPLTMVRTWNRFSLYRAKMFESWGTPFENRISFNGCAQDPGSQECEGEPWSTVFVFRSRDGATLKYTKNDDGIYYEIKAKPVSKLTRNQDGTWTLVTEDRKVERYTKGGLIKEVKNEQGIGWTFSYSGSNNTLLYRVTHTSGRYIEFSWQKLVNSSFGYRVTRVMAPNGKYVDYTFTNDDYGKLKTVSLPGTPKVITTYHYSGEPGEVSYNSHLLTGKSIAGLRFSTFRYSAEGRATSTEHAGGVEKYSFSYVDDAIGELSTTEINPLGKQAVYKFKDEKLQSITGKASAHCAASYSDVAYDKNGYKDNAADFEGSLTDFNYDDQGHLLKRVEAYGESQARTTEYGWDATRNRLTSIKVLGLNETSYDYREDGRIESVSIKNLSGNGVANQVRVTKYSYTLHPNGVVASMTVDGPLSGASDAYTVTYSTAGDVLTVKNSLGHMTTYSGYNGYGQPGSIIGANGERVDFVYDDIGRLLEGHAHRNAGLQKTLYKYDTFGRLAAVTHPDGVRFVFQYDVAGRLIAEYRSEGVGLYSQKAYTYNAMSLPLSEETRWVTFEPAQGTVQ